MTRQERIAVLQAAPEGVPSQWRDIDENLVALKAKPCPFYLFKECTVYESRPYNCRRFACMRPDPKAEPFELGEGDLCKNFWERFAVSREVRRYAALIQRRAQRWALTHGWSHDES
jgi:Fe-S-cluster containining protein